MRRKKNSEIGVQVGRILPVVLACCVIAPCAFGQSQPDGGSAGPSPKATLVDGEPALALDYGAGSGLLIVYGKWHDEPALRFAVHVEEAFGLTGRQCSGFIWISNSRIAWIPGTSFSRKCDQDTHDVSGKFDLPRTAVTMNFKNPFGMSVSFYIGSKRLDDGIYSVFSPDSAEWNRTQAQSVNNNLAKKWLQLALSDFDAAREQFEEMTNGVFAYALLPDQQKALDSQLDRAVSLAHSGNLSEALTVYVAALQNLPSHAPFHIRDQLREKIVTTAAYITPTPPVPEEAKRHLAYALAAISDWKADGDAGKLTDADAELDQVTRLAPWRAEAYYNLGIVPEGQNRYAAAARNLKLYLLAAPGVSDAAEVQQKIYQLDYKAGAR